MQTADIDFWYEFSSPYSYLSVMRIEALAQTHNIAIHWRPFLLAPVFMALGWNDSPFNIYPPKGRYMWKDIARQAEKHALPFTLPSRYPREAKLAAQVALNGSEEPWIAGFSKAVMQANFVHNQDIAQPEVIRDILTALALPAEKILAEAQDSATEQKMQQQIQQALEYGIFGAPSFIVRGDLFWGNDRLDDAIHWAAHSHSHS